MSNYRFFIVETSDDTVVARAVDQHLQGTTLAELVKLELLQIVDEDPGKNLVVNFEGVKLVSSSVISSLLTVKRHVVAASHSMKLCCMADSLRYVFKTLNMDGTVFDIFETVDEAVTSGRLGKSYYDICGELSPPDEENP